MSYKLENLHIITIMFIISINIIQTQKIEDSFHEKVQKTEQIEKQFNTYSIQNNANINYWEDSSNKPNVTIYFMKNSTDIGDKLIYKNNELESQFDQSIWNRQCCSSPDLYNYVYDSNDKPTIRVTNVQQSGQITILAKIEPKFNEKQFTPKIINKESSTIQQSEYADFQIELSCPKRSDLKYDNYWTALEIEFKLSSPNQQSDQTINVYYIFVCNQKFRPIKYAISLLLLTLLLSIIVFYLAIYSTPKSIVSKENFQRFELKWYHSIIYALLIVLIALLNQYMVKNQLEQIMNIVMGFITGLSSWFFFNELQCHFKAIQKKVSKTLFKVYIFSFQVMDIISMIVSISLVLAWIFTGKTWYLSDILAIFLLGSIMKLLMFKNLKQAFLFLLMCLLVDSLGGLIVYLKKSLSYDILFINQYNEPFLIAIPSINVLYDKFCNWLPVTGTAFPGILINYCYRYDKSQKNTNTKAFTFICLFGYVFGSTIYMIVATFNIHTWPYSLINYPLMCLFLFLFAYKRREHQTLWNGSFVDIFSSNQFTITEKPDDEQIQHISLFEGLKINSMEISEAEDEQQRQKSINHD